MTGPPLGAHVSIAGGMRRAITRGEELGCQAIQVFVKNASRWRGPPLTDEAAEEFRRAHAASDIGPVVAHAAYLINLAATDADKLARSRDALGDELDRCQGLGIPQLVVHPGAHLGAGEEAGIRLIAESLDRVYEARPDCAVKVLLEVTAGQGTVLGYRLEQLAAIRAHAACRQRLGICVDTCHAFAAGYALDDSDGYEQFFASLAALFGAAEPSCLHLNDSQRERGARRDRHANLGEGEIGLGLFRRLLADARFAHRPMILETPLGEDGGGHGRDLALLASLRAEVRRRGPAAGG